MAARPQTNLRSIGRRRFAHLSDFGDEIHVDANIPWGASTLFTLEFRDDSRHYAIHTSNNRYLSRDGRLLEKCNEACLFAIEYFGGSFALRDTQGLYLAPLGSKVSIHPPPLAPAGGRLAPFRTNVLTDWFVFFHFFAGHSEDAFHVRHQRRTVHAGRLSGPGRFRFRHERTPRIRQTRFFILFRTIFFLHASRLSDQLLRVKRSQPWTFSG